MSSVVQWFVRRLWPHLPAVPIVAFAALAVYIGFCNAHLPCAPIRLDLGLPSEDAIPADTYAADAPPGTIRWTFRYAPTGTEFHAGVPYWIFRALPRLYPEEFVGAPADAPWTKFGLVPADPPRANGLPRGMAISSSDLQLPGVSVGVALQRVAFNCAGCHTSEYYGPDGARHEVDGMPNHVADTQGYKRFIYRAVSSPRFTPENVIAAVDNELVAAGHAPLTTKEQLVYGLIVAAMRDPNATKSWMNARPDNGPGRIDAFDAVKYETLKVPDDNQNACVDLPSIWNQGPQWRPWHHWDGNTKDLHARNYGSVVGVGGSPQSVRGGNVDAVGDWIDNELGPPPFPFGPRRGAQTDVARGLTVYTAQCASCHGIYDPATRTVSKVNDSQLMQVVDVATDDRRWKAFDAATAKALDDWGAAIGIWTDDAFRPASHGYLATPLDGIWARAPYLHDGAVPTLRALLSPAKQRPAVFWRGNRHYDAKDMGWVWDQEREDGQRLLFRYDTQDARGGNHNDGHEYLVPDDADREALLDYLATL